MRPGTRRPKRSRWVLSTLEINQAPSISPIADVLNFAQPDFVLQVTASDPDLPANQLRFALDEAPPGATIDSESGAIQWAPTSSGTYPFTVRVDDQGIPNLSDSESFSVTVTNAAPTIADQTFALAENSPIGVVIGTAAASDGDGDAISFTIIGGNPDGAVAIDPGSGLITVASSQPLDFETNSTLSLTLEAKDDATPPLARSATVTLNLTNVNEPPSVPDQSFAVADGTVFGAIVGTVAASDPDDEALNYSITSGNEAGVFAIDPLTGTIRIVAQATLTDTTGLNIAVTDSGTPPLSDSAFVSVGITSGSGTIGVTTFAELTTGSAAAISTSGALLQGDLVFNGGEDPEIFAVWGTSDGGNDLGQWESASSAGIVPEGGFSVPVSGFLADTEYFFRFYATNSAGTSWSTPSGTFTANTLQLTGSLIATSADARLLIPTAANDATTWRALDFNDSAWSSGPTGIGYETNNGYQQLIATDVEAAMFNLNSSIFIRLPFDLPDPASLSSLTLRMKYDDAFVAFINGTEIARSANVPATLAWNSRASASRNDSSAIVFEDIDVSAAADSLMNGANILAIHGLNAGTSSSDLLFVPELIATFPETSYAGWVGTFPQLEGEERLLDSDPDHDELSNFFEWATGSNPTVSETDALSQSLLTQTEILPPASGQVEESVEIRFRRRIDYRSQNLHYEIQATTNLSDPDWQPAPTEMLDPPVPSGDGITDIISVQIPIASTGGIEPSPKRQFFRLMISRDPG